MADELAKSFGQFRAEARRDWKGILAAQCDAAEVQELIRNTLQRDFGRIDCSDTDIVVFGSLARKEWTSGSDVDWTLLIDGQAVPEHRPLSQAIDRVIRAIEFRGQRLPAPGTTGIFGTMAFSHDIIHHIGGEHDSNRNTTRRILLLLESLPVRVGESASSPGAYQRVVRAVLNRYIRDDTNFMSTEGASSKIPRFLLNDLVRFWRIMCVDFAGKEWEQEGKKWGLRNIKLRMSRKLIFVSGLLTVFSCYKNPDLPVEQIQGGGTSDLPSPLLGHLEKYVASPPLDIVVGTLSQISLQPQAARLIDAYDQFLQMLNDRSNREELERLQPNEVYSNRTFMAFRSISHNFQDAITDAFFVQDTPLREFIIRYGVF